MANSIKDIGTMIMGLLVWLVVVSFQIIVVVAVAKWAWHWATM